MAAGSLALAAELNVTRLWLRRPGSELDPMDHPWRHPKEDLAANRQRPNLEVLAQQAQTWIRALTPEQALRKAGLWSKDCWLKCVRTNFFPGGKKKFVC
ncbi:MAG: hypothetical protein JO069_15035 [Verrucomicrobia bacterium]|nr:hypothetical protein [Verrucomicrobiota bacterium]